MIKHRSARLFLALTSLSLSTAALAATAATVSPLGAAIAEQGNLALQRIREDARTCLRSQKPDSLETLRGGDWAAESSAPPQQAG
jgi:hypothetical protein